MRVVAMSDERSISSWWFGKFRKHAQRARAGRQTSPVQGHLSRKTAARLIAIMPVVAIVVLVLGSANSQSFAASFTQSPTSTPTPCDLFHTPRTRYAPLYTPTRIIHTLSLLHDPNLQPQKSSVGASRISRYRHGRSVGRGGRDGGERWVDR